MASAAEPSKLHGEVQLQHICSFRATLSAPEIIGPLAEGLRVNLYVTEGEVWGPKLRGRLRPVGGDWLSLHPDGIGTLDVRATMELADGALIYTTYTGVADFGPDGYQRFLEGNLPAQVPLQITPRYYTGHSDYVWLNRLQCIGVGKADLQQLQVSYDIYTIQ